jgi:hypothetical protein
VCWRHASGASLAPIVNRTGGNADHLRLEGQAWFGWRRLFVKLWAAGGVSTRRLSLARVKITGVAQSGAPSAVKSALRASVSAASAG